MVEGQTATRPAPLQGVRVLDLTRLLPGPACTMHLADMGADVIKVEDTHEGDYAPPSMRAVLQRNKRAIRLDLKQPGAVSAFLALVKTADVLLESFRPGVMQRLGLGYEQVAQANPRIVYCSLSGYGQHGPLSQMAGHDLNYCGYSGAASQNGLPSGELALTNVPQADLMGGALTAAMGILAALYDAQRSGLGRHVDVAMADGALAQMIMPLAARARHGRTVPLGEDTLNGGVACYGFYRTADGRQLAVGALERKFWDRFCDVLARADLKPLHRTGDASQEAHVRAEVAQAVAARTLAQWHQALAGVDCCVTPVLDLDEALVHEHFAARGMVVQSTHPVHGDVTHIASPVHMSGFRFAIHRQAPAAGEDSDEILREAGMDLAGIASLRALGAVA